MRLALGERLAARHRIILLDRPGLGWSERRGSDGSSPAYQAAILSAVLDQLGVDRRGRRYF
jgi:pimeloyl-ACP methyl ester carboxylesterase